MFNQKILIIAPYPIVKPQHGGQKRVKAIIDFYQDLFAEVRFVSVFHRRFYEAYGPEDIYLEYPEVIERAEASPYSSDLVIGEAIYIDPFVKNHMTELLQTYRPDVIEIEQIFPYAGLSALLQRLGTHPRLILSSQNIESQLKQSIFRQLDMPDSETQPMLEAIGQLEQAATRAADLVIAVSQEDADHHRTLGAKRWVVAANGIDAVVPSQAAVEDWQQFKRQHKITHALTFVGSAHPPNWYGFQAMLGSDLSFLPSGSQLLLAGNIADYMKQVYPPSLPDYQSFWRRSTAIGRLEEDRLAGLLQQSEVILLPITHGGGSNLKTAEAILSGRKIVATSYAFRAFEAYAGLPNIYIADTADGFKAAIIKATRSPYRQRSADQQQLAAQVQWQYCLQPIRPALEQLGRPRWRL